MEIRNACPECQGSLGASATKCAACRTFRLGRASLARGVALVYLAAIAACLYAAVYVPASPAPAAVTPAADTLAADAIAGEWEGRWTAPEGFLYDARTRLSPRADGSVQARVRWTLRASPRAEEQDRLGRSGEELVTGHWDASRGVLRLEGVALEDPHHILGTDRYRLVLSDDGRVLGGITWDHGTWHGSCTLTRVVAGAR